MLGNFVTCSLWIFISLFRAPEVETDNMSEYVKSGLYSLESVVFVLTILIAVVLYVSTNQSTIHDYVFLSGSFILSSTAINTIVSDEAVVPRWTSVPTCSILFVYCYTFFTLDLYLSSAGNLFGAVVWLVILIFKGPDYENS